MVNPFTVTTVVQNIPLSDYRTIDLTAPQHQQVGFFYSVSSLKTVNTNQLLVSFPIPVHNDLAHRQMSSTRDLLLVSVKSFLFSHSKPSEWASLLTSTFSFKPAVSKPFCCITPKVSNLHRNTEVLKHSFHGSKDIFCINKPKLSSQVKAEAFPEKYHQFPSATAVVLAIFAPIQLH